MPISRDRAGYQMPRGVSGLFLPVRLSRISAAFLSADIVGLQLRLKADTGLSMVERHERRQ